MPVSARLRAELRWKLLLARLLVSIVAVFLTGAGRARSVRRRRLALDARPGRRLRGAQWHRQAGPAGADDPLLVPVLGLVLLAVNVATLWLLEALVPPLDVAGGLSLLLGALVLGLLVPVLETLVGTVRPIVESHPAPAPATTAAPAAPSSAGPAATPAGAE